MTIGIFDPTVEADALTLDRQNPETRLWVAAERFRSFVGTHRWGRIALISDNQAETVIALEDLLPPRSRRHEGGDFKDVLADRGKLQFGSVAFLHSVISIKGQLTGEFVYIGKGRRAAITGVRGPTGDFWPAAKLEVGNLEGPWVKVGENELNSGFRPDRSRHPGSGERFRVDLGGYKSNMGQAQFGKVTFSDSSFAIFLLQDINPDNTDDNLSD